MREIVGRCGANLRRLRIARDLSLSELARRSGVAKGTLSKLEAADGNPTLETLWSIANALGVPFGDLLADAPDDVFLVRAAEYIGVEFPGVKARVIDRVFGNEVIDMVEVTYLAGDVRDAVPDSPGTITRVLVTQGRVRLALLSQTLELQERDFVRFHSDGPHRYIPDGGEARCLLLVSYGVASSRSDGEDPLLLAISAASDAARSRRRPRGGE
jgi:transcriptional regulator with XRE-family HTH domain